MVAISRVCHPRQVTCTALALTICGKINMSHSRSLASFKSLPITSTTCFSSALRRQQQIISSCYLRHRNLDLRKSRHNNIILFKQPTYLTTSNSAWSAGKSNRPLIKLTSPGPEKDFFPADSFDRRRWCRDHHHSSKHFWVLAHSSLESLWLQMPLQKPVLPRHLPCPIHTQVSSGACFCADNLSLVTSLYHLVQNENSRKPYKA